MAKNYGDIPCHKDNSNVMHITVSGTKCLCGKPWDYGIIGRNGKANNIVFRNIDGVTCINCKKIFESQN